MTHHPYRDVLWTLARHDRTDSTCALTLPLWRAPITIMTAGMLAGVAAAAADVHLPGLPDDPITAVFGGLTLALAALTVIMHVWPGLHAHCDRCGTCSVALGIPAGNTDAEADTRLTDAGWVNAPREHADTLYLCPNDRGRLAELTNPGGTR